MHELEIVVTEVTCSELPAGCVPCTSTCWPSCGFSMESSPVTAMSWPFSERVQFPPDCLRQPRKVCWLLGELLAVALDWPLCGFCPGSGVPALLLPVCASAIPLASTSVAKNFLFIGLLLKTSTRCLQTHLPFTRRRWNVHST